MSLTDNQKKDMIDHMTKNIIDGMDLNDLIAIVYEHQFNYYDEMTEEMLIEEMEDHYNMDYETIRYEFGLDDKE